MIFPSDQNYTTKEQYAKSKKYILTLYSDENDTPPQQPEAVSVVWDYSF